MTDTHDDDDLVVDTTSGERDPLTTDEGLAAASETMPRAFSDDGTGTSPVVVGDQPFVDAPDLQVTKDGTDPCAELGRPGGQH